MKKLLLFMLFLLFSSSLLTSVRGFGLITNKGEPLELLKLNTKVLIKGPYAEIRYLCTYKNLFKDTVKAQFFFPRAEDTVLSKFEIQLKKKTISAQVVEKEQARQAYLLNAKESTILKDFTLNKVDKNVLDIKIGDIPANEAIQIEFSFLQPLEVILSKFYGFKLPAILEHKEWAVEVEFVSDRPLKLAENPSHNLKPDFSDSMTLGNTKIYKAFWYGKIDTTKDFVLYFWPERMQDPRVILAAHPTYKEDYVLLIDLVLELKRVDLKKAQTALSLNDKELLRSLEGDIHNAKSEFVFVIDKMDSLRFENVKKALIRLLPALPKNAFFSIISVGSMYYRFKLKRSGNSLEALEREVIKWIDWMEESIKSKPREPDLLKALKHATGPKFSENDDLRTVLIFTGGGYPNSEGIIQYIKENSDKVRFCAIGIGQGAPWPSLNSIGQVGNCESEFVTDEEDLGGKVIHLVKAVISQDISNIHLKVVYFDQEKTILYENEETFRRVLLNDEPFRRWVSTWKPPNSKPSYMALSYNNSLNRERFTKEFDMSGPELTDMWHKLAVNEEQKRSRFINSDLINLSIKYQVLFEGTRLLAKTRENNFDTEISMKNIYLTDLNLADYSYDELTFSHRLFLQYIQPISNFLDEASQSIVWRFVARLLRQAAFTLLKFIFTLQVPLKYFGYIYIGFLIVMLFRSSFLGILLVILTLLLSFYGYGAFTIPFLSYILIHKCRAAILC